MSKLLNPVLQFECELDENGTKVDENCSNRYDFTFNPNNSAGLWNFTFLTYVNDTLTDTSTGSVHVQEDLHDLEEEEVVVESKESNEISNQTIAGIIAVVSLFGMAIVVSQMGSEKSSKENDFHNQTLRLACLASNIILILCSNIAAFAHASSKSAPTQYAP